MPNIVHFIWLKGDLSRPFSFINYLSIRSVAEIQKPDILYLHYDQPEDGNPHWDAILPYVTLNKVEPPEQCGGIPLQYAQYKSDVLRLILLLKYGGVYLDCDFILLKPFHDLMDHPITMLHDGPGQGSVSNGVIFGGPKQKFFVDWMMAMPEELKTGIWASHAVNTPKRLLSSGAYDVQLLPASSFIPFDFSKMYLFETPPAQIDISQSYAIHIWETYWRDYIGHITKKWAKDTDTLFSQIIKPYLV